MIYLLLGKGFEEMEAVASIDILRRADIDVKTAGIGGRQVAGAHGITITADITVEEAGEAELVILPGGMGGVQSILESSAAMELIKKTYEKGGSLAAVCAAPMILGKLGFLKGKKAVIYPGMEKEIDGADVQNGAKAVVDGRVITGQAPGAAIDFALELVSYLKGEASREKVRSVLHYGQE
ncbi:MAG: DJ-1 family glyoxalase III [Oscillospiraceae bacterium]|jgi:4-methyl-5(b-hydroxyethyl)-thiazole monophosphate biosynthesis